MDYHVIYSSSMLTRGKFACQRAMARVLEPLMLLQAKVKYVLLDRRIEDNYKVVIDNIDISQSSKIAVFVGFHSRREVPQNNLRTIESLLNANYNLVYVHNGSLSSREISQLNSLPVVVIERPNIGLDFGAYKIGYDFVLKSLKGSLSLDKLLFINDSCVCLCANAATEFFLSLEKRLVDLNLDIIGPFVNKEIHPHVQSFMMLLSGSTFHDSRYQAYWESYKPISIRRHAIIKGEIGHSKSLIDNGFRMGAYFDFPRLYLDEFPAVQDKLPSSLVVYLYKLIDKKSLNKLPPKIMNNIIYDFLEEGNSSHVFALAFAANKMFPFLKKDLVYRSTFSAGTIKSFLISEDYKCSDTSVLSDVMDDILSRVELRKSKAGISKILKRYGIK